MARSRDLIRLLDKPGAIGWNARFDVWHAPDL
jgi:hypothetical protein